LPNGRRGGSTALEDGEEGFACVATEVPDERDRGGLSRAPSPSRQPYQLLSRVLPARLKSKQQPPRRSSTPRASPPAGAEKKSRRREGKNQREHRDTGCHEDHARLRPGDHFCVLARSAEIRGMRPGGLNGFATLSPAANPISLISGSSSTTKNVAIASQSKVAQGSRIVPRRHRKRQR
jgi:hypothetical protein